ncbi:MAG: recombination mediator RecR [candidate division Zixibacteria bacterium]|nr:recombination mediator RecR [candidate division Zixibacteria bacterium]MDH3938408.1 recombination mediator RecR [candidate division Zixibacteria bacterium]MDH4033946.1 recombination mediator RecR [candidate division Zixibacteria bacterium]
MFKSATSVERLANRLARMPGIGRKSASRLAFYILNLPKEEALELSDIIREVIDKVGFCSTCFNISENDPCRICSDPKRDATVLCVVEETADAAAIDKVDGFNGRFHILGGRLSPLDGLGPDELKIQELLKRLSGDITEVVLATNPNVEGEATAIYLAKLLKPLGVKVTRIARGLPVGSDLEFADSATLGRALEGRQEF